LLNIDTPLSFEPSAKSLPTNHARFGSEDVTSLGQCSPGGPAPPLAWSSTEDAAYQNDVKSAGNFNNGDATLHMNQDSVGVAVGYLF
jgi:hypothetical protein